MPFSPPPARLSFPMPSPRSAAQKYSQGLEVWDLRTSTRLRVVPGPVLGYQVDIQKEREKHVDVYVLKILIRLNYG